MSGERPAQIYTDSSHLFLSTPKSAFGYAALLLQCMRRKFKDKRRRNIPSQNELFGKQEPDSNARVSLRAFRAAISTRTGQGFKQICRFLKNTETLLKNGKNDFFSQRFYPRSACDGENRPLSPICRRLGISEAKFGENSAKTRKNHA